VRREEHGRIEQGAGGGGGRKRHLQRDRRPHARPADLARQDPRGRARGHGHARRRARREGGGAVMKTFTSANPKSVAQALTLLRDARTAGRSVAVAGGGSDILGMMKERLVAPDVLVRLRAIDGLDTVKAEKGGVTIGGQITLDALSRHELLRRQFAVLADAAADVATPQIRNVATLAGNVCQRPWCWYYRNGFKCFKAGGNTCYSANGENEFHAIFGGGPSYIVHPSDTAPALVALDAKFTINGPSGRRTVKAADFFTLPTVNAARENVLADGELLESIALPAGRPSL